MPVQFMADPEQEGEELAILPRREYEFLVAAISVEAGVKPPRPTPVVMAEMIARDVHPMTAARTWRGLSQRGLSRLSGVHPSSLSQMERRGSKPSQHLLLAVARALDVPPGWLSLP